MVMAGCGSSVKTAPTTTTSSSHATTTAGYQQSTVAGVGVTATTVKIGVALVDFTCIQQFVDSIRVNQDKIYKAFIDDINAHGGVAGRQIVPVYHSYCPIQSAQALALCTQFTEDDKVFAVMANFEDFSGDAQTCVAKDHNTVLLTFDLTQAIMNQSPPGLMIYPGTNPERVDAVLADLLQKQHTLDGKKVAILGETVSQGVVKSSVEPALKRLGVATGSTAILSVAGTDTSAAQAQLDSFIEKWKTEGVDALFVSGTQVSSQQFIEKVRQQMPNVLLITDINTVLTYGQEEQSAHKHPNPYEGIITANGPTSKEYDQSANWTYCSTIYQQQTGTVAPNAEAVVPGPNGKTLDTYGGINDACQLLTLFHDIATRVGPNLNVPNWVHTVDTYGPIRNAGGGQFASLSAGHYDIDDTFRLEAFDSTIGLKGDWRPLTPLQDISGS
jgi:ABC-type branched-subunit amino acid transport system substrate-binding protein